MFRDTYIVHTTEEPAASIRSTGAAIWAHIEIIRPRGTAGPSLADEIPHLPPFRGVLMHSGMRRCVLHSAGLQ